MTSAVKRRVFLALGSNLGDRWQYLRNAVALLPDVVATSQVYETEPVGGPLDQGPYLNMVAELSTALTPGELLAAAQAAEQRAERVRVVVNGPRTLDVDVLWIDGETVDSPDLIVPHPRMWERRFVLAPLSELAPDILPSNWEANAIGNVEPIGRV